MESHFMDSENQQKALSAEEPSLENQPDGEATPPVSSAEYSTVELESAAPPTQSPTPPAETQVRPATVVDSQQSAGALTLNANRLMINYLVVALVFLGIGVLFGRLIFGSGSMAGMNETALREIVAEAVASAGGSADPAGPATAQLVDDDPVMGAEDAPLTIVEFSDFNCPYCGRFASETLPRLLEEYEGQIRFVYRDLPIIGQQLSVETAIAAECAHDQGKFTEYHNLLYSNMEIEMRTREVYIDYATQLGLDEAIFTSCLDDQASSDEVVLDMLDGQGLGIDGTPGFYINGRFISGALPYDIFKTVIDRELARNEL
jgi:protein-disulfide isomerase